jgi:hypothetical protein
MKASTRTKLEGNAMGQMNFFSYSEMMEKISKCGDPLERLDKVMEWEVFGSLIAKMRAKDNLSAAGRPAFDGMMLFKVLVMQSLYSLSDAQMEFQIRDRFSFRRFLGLTPDDTTSGL